MKRSIQFVRNEEAMEHELKKAKHTACIHCGRTGTLNRHDKRHGNDPDSTDKQTIRGQRLWCSNRGKRGGCGKTTCLCFAWVLPNHSMSAPSLGRLLKYLCTGVSIQQAWELSRCPVTLQTVYHILQRLRMRMGEIRSFLIALCRPRKSLHRDPMITTAEHLRYAFSQAACPVEAFQDRLQTPIMG